MSRLKRKTKTNNAAAVKTSPQARAHLTQALDAQNNGDYQTAIALYDAALQDHPDLDAAWNNIGYCYYHMHQFAAALNAFKKAAPITQDTFFTTKMTGLTYTRMNQFANAERFLNQAYALKSDDLEVLNWLIFALNQNGKPREVLNLLTPLDKKTFTAEIYSDYMDALIRLDRKDEAVTIIETAIEADPKNWSLYTLLGKAYFEVRQHKKSVATYKKVYDANPDDINATSNYAMGLSYNYQFDQALELYHGLLEKLPHDYRIYVNISNTYRMTQDMDKAVEYAKIAQRIAPENVSVNYAVGIHSVTNEDYDTGWVNSEYFWHINKEQKYKPPLQNTLNWYGENLSQKRLVIYADQGVGDTILFLRYVPVIIALFPDCNITIIAEKKLKQAIRSFLGDTVFHFLDKYAPLPNTLTADYMVASSSLPLVMKTQLDTIPDIFENAQINKKLDYKTTPDDFVIGLSWRTSSSDAGYKRSIDLKEFAFLSQIPNVKLVDLQYGDTVAERAACGFEIIHDDRVNCWESLQDHMDQIAACDLVISVDNTAVHVAGSMGKPVWTILPYDCFWRCWHLKHPSTPWYPTMQLFRQDSARDYAPVLKIIHDQVIKALDDPDSMNDIPPFTATPTAHADKTVLIINDRFSQASWVDQVLGASIKDNFPKHMIVSLDKRQIDNHQMPVPTLKDFDDPKYLSEYRFLDPNIFHRIQNADEIVIDGGHDLNGCDDFAKRLLYLAYVAKHIFRKKVTITHLSYLPEGNFDLTDPQIIAFYRKVYLIADRVTVPDEKSAYLLEQLRIPHNREPWGITPAAITKNKARKGIMLADLPSLGGDVGTAVANAVKEFGDGIPATLLAGGPYFDAQSFHHTATYISGALEAKLDVHIARTQEDWQSKLHGARLIITGSENIVSYCAYTNIACIYVGNDVAMDILDANHDSIAAISTVTEGLVAAMIIKIVRLLKNT